MKYIKTFENKFTDIFKKRKVLPKEFINFGEVLTNFIEKNIDNKEWDVYSDIHEPSDKKYYGVIRIWVDPYDLDDAAEVLELHYNDDRKSVLYCYYSKMNFMDNIQKFLGDIIDRNADEDISSGNDNRYWISLDKLPEIITKINDSDYELYNTTNKFNI